MKMHLKPAPPKARALLEKLLALADRGIDGEKLSAQNKIARLKARFDFTSPPAADMPDLFSGQFKHSATARRIYSFRGNDLDVANSVKWAIESATNIPCVFRKGNLLAEAAPAAVRRLTDIAAHIDLSFRSLIHQFSALNGVTSADRGAFVMGLYDGMMNEVRHAGQPLPKRPRAKKMPKARKGDPPRSSGLDIHPYTLAVGLGKQIRFSAPLEQITAELAAAAQKHLTPPA